MTRCSLLRRGIPGLAFVLMVVVGPWATGSAVAQTTQPAGGARQPRVTNQFTTVTGGALQARRPGLYVQQGIAVHKGDTSFFTGDADQFRRVSFFRDTFQKMIEAVLDTVQQFLSVLNLAQSSGVLSQQSATLPPGVQGPPPPSATPLGPVR